MTIHVRRVVSRLTILSFVMLMLTLVAQATPGIRGQGYVLNNGLWPANVIAVALGSDVDVWVTKTGMVYDHHGIQDGKRVGFVSSATWADGRPDLASVAVGDAKSTTVTFFKNANVPTNPHAHVVTKLVSGFVVKNVYPGVDVQYSMDKDNARFDIVTERAELAKQVRLTFGGAMAVESPLHPNGNNLADQTTDLLLVVDNVKSVNGASEAASYVAFKSLKAYQNGVQVPVKFVTDANNNALSFEGNFAPSQPLIIDPTVYGTYLGGPEDDMLADVVQLSTGEVAVGGTTTQVDFPAELGKYKATISGTSDGFIAVYDAALTSLKRYSYIGGADPDSVKAITVDAQDNIYAAGTTLSPQFPITAGTAGQVYKSLIDAYALKMNSGLTTLIFSTFIGGNKDDIALDIAIDGDLSVYVCGATNSTASFPTNAGFKKTFGGLIDGFLTKLTSSGASYAYSTYFGVEGTEYFNSVVVEISGSPILTGFTNSSNFQTFPVPGMFNPQRPYDRTIEGTSDAFVTKFGQDGGTLVYSTFIGGNGDEEGKGIFVDELGRAYLVGETTSTNLPATAGFKQTRIGGRDVFLFILSDDGKELVGCTYYGGTGDDRVKSVTRDKTNAAIVGGVTSSNDFQTEGSGTNGLRRGASDGFVAKFTVGALIYADLVGGNGLDTVTSVFCDKSDDIYACGITTSSDFGFPSTAAQKTRAGKIDGFIIKQARGTIDLTAPTGGESWCIGSNQTVSWAASTDMATTDKYRIDVTTDNGTTWIEVAKDLTSKNYQWKPTTIAPGNYKLRVTATRGQTSTTESEFKLGPGAAITTQPTPVAVCQGAKAEFTVVATGEELKYKWRKDGTLIPSATAATLTINAVAPANAGTYIAEVTGKCGAAVFTTPVTLKIETNPTVTTQPAPQTLVEGQALNLSVTSSIAGSRYQWKKNGNDIPGATTREYSITTTTLSDSGDYSVTIITDCGTVTSNVAKVVITPTSSVREVRLATGSVALTGEMPVTEVCSINIDLVDYSEVLVQVVDMQGGTTQVPPVRLMHEGGSFTIDLPCSSLTSGSYMLDVRIAGLQAYLPFVMLR